MCLVGDPYKPSLATVTGSFLRAHGHLAALTLYDVSLETLKEFHLNH